MFKIDSQGGGRRSSPSKSHKTPPKRKSVSKTNRKSPTSRKPVRKSGRKTSPKHKPVRKSGRKTSPKGKSVRKSGRKTSPKRKSGRKSSQRGGARGSKKRVTAITSDRNYNMSGPRSSYTQAFPVYRANYGDGAYDAGQVMINSREALRRNMLQAERQIDNDCGWIKGAGLDAVTAQRLTTDCARNVEDRLDNRFNRPDHRDLINTYDPRTHTPAQLKRDKQWLSKKAGQAAYLGETAYNYGVKPTAQLAYNYGLKPVAKAVGKRIRRNTRRHVTHMVDRDGESPFEH